MLGIEFVKDQATKQPGREECAQAVENARELGLLLGKGGLWGQTIRFAPPMCITKADADFLLAVLDEAIGSI
jgi:alanine-glyoxylate transaminase/(R)-3-amino-2-methylpropionate-pyruvate transaminase